MESTNDAAWMAVPGRVKIRLRPFLSGDYDAVFDLWSRCEGIGLGDSDTREAIAAYLARNPGMSAVAVATAPGGRADQAGTGDGGRSAPEAAPETLVGAVLCGHDGRRGTIHHLAVEPSHRRRGVARALVEWCLERLRGAGIIKCNIFVWGDNEEGAAFWKREGWDSRGDLVVMQRWTSAEAAASAASTATRTGAEDAGGCGPRDC